MPRDGFFSETNPAQRRLIRKEQWSRQVSEHDNRKDDETTRPTERLGGDELSTPLPTGYSGKTIGEYRVVEEIGRGGMGVVYKAHDAKLDRDVAVKILPPHLASDADFAARFVREARAAAQLDHTGIVQVYQVGQTSEMLYIAMQYVDSRSLSAVIREEGPLSAERALDIVKQVARALGEAHEHGIIHRDVKPSNILVDERGRVKVTDFGLAKNLRAGETVTETGVFVGTPEYSSPEQCDAQPVDQRSDIYSLGVVLYEMLAGKVPFQAETPFKLFEKILYDEPTQITKVAPAVPRSVSALLHRMMAKDMEDRYADCAELVVDIERIERGEAIKTRKRRPVKARKRAYVPALLVLAAGFVAMAAFFFLPGRTWRDTKPKPEPVPAGPGVVVEEPAAVPPARMRRVVVVRDFDNPTNDTELDWLRVGIADMLITDLAGCDFLDVVSREKARDFGAKEPGALDIEVRGSFARAGGDIRIMATVVDIEGGTVLKAVKDTGTESEIFDLIDRVSSGIRTNLEELLAERLGKPVELAALSGGIAERLLAPAIGEEFTLALKKAGAASISGGAADKAEEDRNKADVNYVLADAGGKQQRFADARAAQTGVPGEARPEAPAIAERKRVAAVDAEKTRRAIAAQTKAKPEAGKAMPSEPAIGGEATLADRGDAPAPAAKMEKDAEESPAVAEAKAPAASRAAASRAAAEDGVEAGGPVEQEASAGRMRAGRGFGSGGGERAERLRELMQNGGPGAPALVQAVRARYQAKVIMESEPDAEAMKKALALLEKAKELAPNLRGLDRDIAVYYTVLAKVGEPPMAEAADEGEEVPPPDLPE